MNRVYYTLLLGFVLACSGTSKEAQKLFNEAAAIHNQAVASAGKLKDQLKKLAADSLSNKDSVFVVLAALKAWDEDLVEVPGNEVHHHHDDEDDHHHQGKQGDISAQEMLAVQQEMFTRLTQLEERARAILTTNQ